MEKLIRTMLCDGKPPDLLMCIGDDRSDEDMFETINSTASSSLFPIVPEVFACTVGQKPSKAKYFVDDTSEVLKLLKRIAAISTQNDNIAVSRVNFDVPLELAD